MLSGYIRHSKNELNTNTQKYKYHITLQSYLTNGISFSYQEFLNKEVLKLKDNLGRTIVHVAAEKGISTFL